VAAAPRPVRQSAARPERDRRARQQREPVRWPEPRRHRGRWGADADAPRAPGARSTTGPAQPPRRSATTTADQRPQTTGHARRRRRLLRRAGGRRPRSPRRHRARLALRCLAACGAQGTAGAWRRYLRGPVAASTDRRTDPPLGVARKVRAPLGLGRVVALRRARWPGEAAVLTLGIAGAVDELDGRAGVAQSNRRNVLAALGAGRAG
jgi:hypothetical protein